MLVVALGCNITASLGSGEASTGSMSDPETTSGEALQGSSSSGGAAEGTGGLGTTSGGSSGDASTGSTGSSSEGWLASTTGASTGFEDEDVCRSPFDGSCMSCIQESCCEALLECIDSPDCACLLGCLEFAPDFLSCVGIPACQGGFGTQQLAACAGFECTQPCGFPGPPDENPGFPGER